MEKFKPSWGKESKTEDDLIEHFRKTAQNKEGSPREIRDKTYNLARTFLLNIPDREKEIMGILYTYSPDTAEEIQQELLEEEKIKEEEDLKRQKRKEAQTVKI